MNLSQYSLEMLHHEGDFLLYRARRRTNRSRPHSVLVKLLRSEHAGAASVRMLEHEYSLWAKSDARCVLRPLALEEYQGRAALILGDRPGELLTTLMKPVGSSMELGLFLRLAVGAASALGEVHRRGILHKDIKPAHFLVRAATGQAWLTGFGIASRLQRERQAPEPPEMIAGTLAYMAPEQTGRMNRSIDARSDLYALGVTLYQMLTGVLPFDAVDPVEWLHCHIAKTPVAPTDRSQSVPAPVSAIIMKLLAKTAEERYQTTDGLVRDLQCCLRQWKAKERIESFPLGEHDTPDRLLIPEKLYGRAGEIGTLLDAFDRIVKGGRQEIVLVSGYSGIGKSSVVNELHRVLVPPRGVFAAGKFDQYKRDVPYATLAQAFQVLIRRLLGRSAAELQRWRNALQEALGLNGQLLVDLVPELKLILGQQPPVPELPPHEAQQRFQLTFRRFLGVFARPEHPLALFLDDLQWLDAASLDLLEDLLTQTDVRYFLLIGAYRDNEVTFEHSLMRKLATIRAAGVLVEEIVLTPLPREEVGRLVADALHCDPDLAAPLAQLVFQKTAGNPFFAIQFLSALYEEGSLKFEHGAGRWSWDLTDVSKRNYTDNVVELMAGKLSRLAADTQHALHHLACLGSSADSDVLAIALQKPLQAVQSALLEAQLAGLIVQVGNGCRFLHDRIQEAAYYLIPEDKRAAVHLSIGRRLAAHTAPAELEEMIFDIVNQFNRGASLVTARGDRMQLANLNFIAGKRAAASAAYASALRYIAAAASALPEDAWEHDRELAFAIGLEHARAELRTGAFDAAELRLRELWPHAATSIERAAVTCQRQDVYTLLDRHRDALAVGLEYLRTTGVDLPEHPTDGEVDRAYAKLLPRIARPDQLSDLPDMTDAASLATLEVITYLTPAAFFSDPNLYALLLSVALELSLKWGLAAATCDACARVGSILVDRFDELQLGYRIGRLGFDLVERRGFRQYIARAYASYCVSLMPLGMRAQAQVSELRQRVSVWDGADRMHRDYYGSVLGDRLLAAGRPLEEIENVLTMHLVGVSGTPRDLMLAELGLVRTLRGKTYELGAFDAADFDEPTFVKRVTASPELALNAFWYAIDKLQAAVFTNDTANAMAMVALAEQHQATFRSHKLTATTLQVYAGLACAASGDTAGLHRHLEQIRRWGNLCPEAFAESTALLAAELARHEGRGFEAMRLYEDAIEAARRNGVVHHEALAHELCARFYLAAGVVRIARGYLRDARSCYARWGAEAKVRQLDRVYPDLIREPATTATGTIQAPVEQLDLATVLQVSQAISGEIVFEKLLLTVLRTALAHAGAERALLILSLEGEHRVVAEAITSGDTVSVQARDALVGSADLPETIIRYVLNTNESVMLEDAATPNPFSADPYIGKHHARSILCLPITSLAKLLGVLYLENNLAPGVFTAGRATVLKLLGSQAAISLENSRLYRGLAERESKIRRLIDANIIGIFIWDFDGRILEANEAFLFMLGYDREDLTAGRLRWTDLTPPEWRERDAELLIEHKQIGRRLPFEKEYLRKDGSRVPVLVGAATFEEGKGQGVAFVLDLTERKRADGSLQRARAELAHAVRVITVGELTGSIAHEVNQPLGSMVASAAACAAWLESQPPDIARARRALERIVRGGKQASAVIERIRALIKRKAPQNEWLDLNETVSEVIALTQYELHRHNIMLETRLAAGLPRVQGDRVQLEQVLLNLIMNAIESMSAVDGRQRQLTIVSERDEPKAVRIEVHDSGTGIEPQTAARLFEPFYTTKANGIGIGLSISHSIVEAHGGRLTADPRVPCGAVFRLSLPVEQPAAHT